MTNNGTFSAFLQLQKVDVAKREVWGVAAVEQPDRAREIMDYEKSLPNFLNWSRDMHKASGGLSQGNVRAMHRDVAAGKVIHLEPRDADRAIYIGARIVDDNEWKKVLEGVYTGFSVGGSYGLKWADPSLPGYTRYEAKPVEISLVDVPCMPGATFEVVKADGSSEMRKLATSDLAKHDGPGPHESGSSQEVHGGDGGGGVPDRVTEAAGTEAEFNAREADRRLVQREILDQRKARQEAKRAAARAKFVSSAPKPATGSAQEDALGMTEEEFNALDEMGHVKPWGVTSDGMRELESMRGERKKASGVDSLNSADKKALQSTRALKTSGFKPMSDADARSISSEAAEILNSKRGSGYTVMGSSFSGFDYEGDQPKSVTFPGVAFGSGESKKKLKQGAAILEEYGFKVRIIDDVNYKGVVVSKSLDLTNLLKGAGMETKDLLNKLSASSDPAMQQLAEELYKAFPPAKGKKDEGEESDSESDSGEEQKQTKGKGKANPFEKEGEAEPGEEEEGMENDDPNAEEGVDGEEGDEAEEQPAGAPSPEQTEAIRAVVIQLLEELGFVQEQGGEMGAPKAVKFVTAGDLNKRLNDRTDALQKAYDGLTARHADITSDLAKLANTVDTMEKRGGPAPVIRDLGVITPETAAVVQQEALLKGMIDGISDPVARQALQAELTKLAIRQTQIQTNTK